MYDHLLDLLHDDEGQTMAEYAVVLAVITIFVIAALTALAGGISGALGQITDVLG